jgi:hypothetical protein
MQTLIVAALVGACSVYTLWTLMPSGARRALAAGMLRIPHLPRRIETRLQKAAQATSACGCDGCDRSDKKPDAKTPASRTITFHPRPRR